MGSHGWIGGVLVFVGKVELARDLMFQPDDLIRIPVRLPVSQGTGESSSADHT